MSRVDADGIVKRNSSRLARNGIEVRNVLGRGTRGTAYDIGGGLALKVTSDESEASVSMKLVSSPKKHLVRVERVFKFPDEQAWGIVQERLVKLTREEQADVFVYSIASSETNLVDLRPGGPDAARLADLASRIPIYEIAEELRQLGVTFFNDMTPENVMKRQDGTIVLIDIGYSTVKGAEQPPTMERRVVESAESDIEIFVNKNRDLLTKNGIGVGQSIGQGTMGVAFETQDGKVLKVTVDKNEAKASMKILGKDVPGVVSVFKVFKFPRSMDGQVLYGISQERLAQLPSRAKGELRQATEEIEKLFGGNVSSFSLGWEIFSMDVYRKQQKLPLEDRMHVRRALAVLKKFGIDKMMDALKAEGIRFHDYHVGNIMMGRDGLPKVIDLGDSFVTGAAEVPQLENVGRMKQARAHLLEMRRLGKWRM